MPFLATCPFCPAKFQLSRKVLGGSVRCPECGNYFTAVPPEEEGPQAGVPSLRALAGKKRVSTPAPPVAEEISTAADEDQVIQTPSSPVIRNAEDVASPSLPAPAGTPIPAWINIWGLAALVLSGGGLLFAAVSPWVVPLRYLTIPLSGLGLLICLVGFLATMDGLKIKDVVWLFLGGMVSLGVLLVSVFWAHLLNLHWDSDFAVPQAFPNKPMQVSVNNPTVGKDLTEVDWIDAGKAAYRQGDVFVKVMGVKIDQAPVQPPLKDKAAMKSLLISLKIANIGQLRMIPYTGQGSGKHPAVLKDSTGKVLQARNFGPNVKVAGQANLVTLRASKQVEDLLLFDSPEAAVTHLDLEISAAAWGGNGTCKFRIPARMISWPDPSKGGQP